MTDQDKRIAATKAFNDFSASALLLWLRVMIGSAILWVLFNAGPAAYFDLRPISFWFALFVSWVWIKVEGMVRS